MSFFQMPFRRRRFPRFRRRRFGGIRGKSRFSRRMRNPWRAIRNINKRLASEVKKADTAVTDATIAAAGATFNLTAIAQGDTSSTREGNQIQPKYISGHGNVTLIGANAATVRMLIVQDTKQVADTTPAVTDVLTASTPESLFNATSMSTGRFNIIYDKVFWTNSSAIGSSSVTIPFKIFKRLDRKPYIKVKYNGATNTDFDNGSIVVMVLAQTDENGAIDGNFRLGFYDN